VLIAGAGAELEPGPAHARSRFGNDLILVLMILVFLAKRMPWVVGIQNGQSDGEAAIDQG